MPEPISHRLLFALRPPAHVIPHIAAIREAVRPVTRVDDDRLHITLFLTDDLPERPPALVAAMQAAASSLHAAPFRMIVDELVRGLGSALLRPSESVRGLAAFQARLTAALIRGGIRPRKAWRFDPHITLGYGGLRGPTCAIDAISWTASELVLLDSFVGTHRHVTLARWALTD